jgi:Bacteriocin-protection, YdeI or OmpD-Associated
MAKTILHGTVLHATVLHGTVHHVREDLRDAILADDAIFTLWQSLTPLGRNEFICWVEDAKQAATRQRRIQRTCEELLEGKRRPCCWPGCIHRTDKAPSKWQQDVLIEKKRR